MPKKTNLFNQQEFLLNSNQGAQAQDLVGRIVGYAAAHNQDIHNAAPGSTREMSCVCTVQAFSTLPGAFGVMCKGNPRKPYLRQSASAKLESSPCILSYHPDSEEQTDRPDNFSPVYTTMYLISRVKTQTTSQTLWARGSPSCSARARLGRAFRSIIHRGPAPL